MLLPPSLVGGFDQSCLLVILSILTIHTSAARPPPGLDRQVNVSTAVCGRTTVHATSVMVKCSLCDGLPARHTRHKLVKQAIVVGTTIMTMDTLQRFIVMIVGVPFNWLITITREST